MVVGSPAFSQPCFSGCLASGTVASPASMVVGSPAFSQPQSPRRMLIGVEAAAPAGLAARGEAAADLLARPLLPTMGHLTHMPSHQYFRCVEGRVQGGTRTCLPWLPPPRALPACCFLWHPPPPASHILHVVLRSCLPFSARSLQHLSTLHGNRHLTCCATGRGAGMMQCRATLRPWMLTWPWQPGGHADALLLPGQTNGAPRFCAGIAAAARAREGVWLVLAVVLHALTHALLLLRAGAWRRICPPTTHRCCCTPP